MMVRLSAIAVLLMVAALAQNPPAAFQSKVNLVMVPVVVRDRDGHAVGNLVQDDFQLFDSGRKQAITKFTVEKATAPTEATKPEAKTETSSPRAEESTGPRFVALVFDTMNLHMGGMGNFEQGYFTLAREAARRYIAKLNPADRVAVYATAGGDLDFTSDRALLDQWLLKLRTTPDTAPINIRGVSAGPTRMSAGAPPPQPAGVFDPYGAQMELQTRSSFRSLNIMSRRLAGLPGARVMVFLSPGFALPPELFPDALRAIEIAVSSGVVINVLNVRGLEARVPEALPGQGYYDAAARAIEEPLARLADGTGGTYIRDTNDYDGALRRLAAPPEYMYLLGFEPDDLKQDGRVHSLKVTLRNPHGLSVQARRGYLDPKPGTDTESDWGAGFAPMAHGNLPVPSPIEKELENAAASPGAGDAKTSIAAPFFYRGRNVARVNLALDIPAAVFEPVKQDGKLIAELAVLGLAYNPAGKIAARFTDKVSYEFENQQQFDEFASHSLHYERSFDIAAGKYNLKVAYRRAKENMGRAEAPLAVEPWDARQLGLSAIALSREVQPAPATEAVAEMLDEGGGPLVFRGMQIVVSGTDRFRQDGLAEAYLEVYEPLLEEKKPVQVELRLRLLDAASGDQKWDSGAVNLAPLEQPSKSSIPVALRLPVSGLAPGAYRAEFTVRDSEGRTATREARFVLE